MCFAPAAAHVGDFIALLEVGLISNSRSNSDHASRALKHPSCKPNTVHARWP